VILGSTVGAALWTRKLVGELIFQKFAVRLSLPTVGRVLKKLGMSPQRPLYRAYQQDRATVKKSKGETYSRVSPEVTACRLVTLTTWTLSIAQRPRRDNPDTIGVRHSV
jgi:hypothetical protein